MNSSDFNFQIIHLTSVDSTNIYAQEILQKENAAEGTVIWADFQTNGKGQQSKFWSAEKSKNLTFSLIVKPGLLIEQQFDLSKIIAIAVKDFLDTLTVGKVEVKWPNDILINKEKVAGILIENGVKGNRIYASVVGIGLNVNQSEFSTFKRPATSLKLSSGNHFVVEEVLNALLNKVKVIYNKYLNTPSELHNDYLSELYGYGIPQKYKDEGGEFVGVVLNVLPNGRLQVNRNGKLKNYDVKEIEFLE